MESALHYAKSIWDKLLEAYPNLELPSIVDGWDGNINLAWGGFSFQDAYVHIEVYPDGKVDCYCRPPNGEMRSKEHSVNNFEMPSELAYFVKTSDTAEERSAKLYQELEGIEL